MYLRWIIRRVALVTGRVKLFEEVFVGGAALPWMHLPFFWSTLVSLNDDMHLLFY